MITIFPTNGGASYVLGAARRASIGSFRDAHLPSALPPPFVTSGAQHKPAVQHS